MGCLDPRVIGELERKEKKRKRKEKKRKEKKRKEKKEKKRKERKEERKYVLHNLTPQFFTQISHQFSNKFQCNILFKIVLFNRRSEMSDILSY